MYFYQFIGETLLQDVESKANFDIYHIKTDIFICVYFKYVHSYITICFFCKPAKVVSTFQYDNNTHC